MRLMKTLSWLGMIVSAISAASTRLSLASSMSTAPLRMRPASKCSMVGTASPATSVVVFDSRRRRPHVPGV